jgi:AraC-like DNA-binding protein
MRLNGITRNGETPPHGLQETSAFLDASPPGTCPDPLMERLVRSLLPDDEADVVLRGFYTDALHSALLKRLADLRRGDSGRAGRMSAQLPAWRLKRVCDYVEASLDGPISLAALAGVAGLSCMYFAAQFRLATGMRPHDYVVRRRIKRARKLLSETATPIVDIALSVGFPSQSHFTTVFKRITGFTPQRWRTMADHGREIHADMIPTAARHGQSSK